MRTTLLAAALLAAASPAQMTAVVNDPNSHGVVGDGLLSLDEAIRVMNVQLSYGALSAAEQAQFRGSPTTVLDTIEIDFNITPIITVEPGKQLTHVEGDVITHVDTNFHGLNGRPIILGGNTPVVFEVNTNHFHLHDIIVVGGQIGCTFDTLLHYHPGVRGRFLRCLFLNQAQVGLQINIPQFPPGQILPIDLIDSVWDGIPLAIEINDAGFSGTLDMTSHGVTIQNCATGLQVDIEGLGSQCKLYWGRTRITGADNAVRVTRTPTSNSVFDLQFVHGEIYASQSAFDFGGNQVGLLNLALHHLDVRAGAEADDYALRTDPRTARFDLAIGECRFDGNVLLQIGTVGQKLTAEDSRFENGAFTVDTIGPPGSFKRNVHESAPITVAPGSLKALSFDSCELVRSSIDDETAGTTTAINCYFGSSTASGNVVNVAPAPARWIGRADVVPNNPPLGGHVDLMVDLQPDTAAAWLLGLAEPGTNLATPLRYLSPLIAPIGIPGPFVGQSTLRLLIPNVASIQGIELYGQPVVFPTAGQSWVPLDLPRGGRFEIQ